jgi:serine/threonine-protein phosphatase 2A regulatory subunit A
VEMLSTELLPAIRELAEDKHWRVRLAIIEYIPVLAQQIGTSFLFQKSEGTESDDDLLNSLCLQWLQDSVYSIREAAANNLFRLTEIFGAKWALQYIFPRIKQLMSSPHYLYRLTVLRALSLLAPAVGEEVILAEILPIIKHATTDTVPNVRFNAAKALSPLMKVMQAEKVHEEIRPILMGLQSDPDADVRYFAETVLSSAA